MPQAKKKIIPMMSPENYIRHRSRSLPFLECLINPEWQEMKIANIIMSRRHSNGNVTLCLYLADLFCQGVKDTHWYFNITSADYDEFKKNIADKQDMVNISYILGHNIIYASLEFGEEWGFDSHKDFNNITKYFLEEDSEETELIDIECGVDGKPAFMRSPDQSRAEAEKIMMKLEKSAGPGNYLIIDAEDTDEFDDFDDDEEFDDFDDDDDDEADLSNEFSNLSIEEKKKLFAEFLERENKPTEAEMDQLATLSTELFNEICDNSEVELLYSGIRDELNKITVCPFIKVPTELLVPGDESRYDTELLKKSFLETYDAIHSDSSKAKKKLEAFRLKYNDLPVSAYLELKFLQDASDKNFSAKLQQYAACHPDYPLIRIMEFHDRILKLENIPDQAKETPGIEYFFYGRTTLHPIELFNYLFLKTASLNFEERPEKILAYSMAISEYDKLPDNENFLFRTALMVLKIRFLINQFENQ